MTGLHIPSCDGSWCDGACVRLEREARMTKQILLSLNGGHDLRCGCSFTGCECGGDCDMCICELIAEIRAEERVECGCDLCVSLLRRAD